MLKKIKGFFGWTNSEVENFMGIKYESFSTPGGGDEEKSVLSNKKVRKKSVM